MVPGLPGHLGVHDVQVRVGAGCELTRQGESRGGEQKHSHVVRNVGQYSFKVRFMNPLRRSEFLQLTRLRSGQREGRRKSDLVSQESTVQRPEMLFNAAGVWILSGTCSCILYFQIPRPPACWLNGDAFLSVMQSMALHSHTSIMGGLAKGQSTKKKQIICT